MSWKSNTFITLTDLYQAYRKAKVDVYYERINIAGHLFSQYEVNLDANLSSLLKKLNSTLPTWAIDETLIGAHSFVPKSIEPEPLVTHGSGGPQFFCSDAAQQWEVWCQHQKEQKTTPKASFRVIGRHPVEFHIISTLWILKVGQNYDACLGADARGSRLRRYSEAHDDLPSGQMPDLNREATGCFRPYAIDFRKWRSDGLIAIRQSLGKKESVVAITMDIRQFYHRICPEFLLDPDFLANAKLKLSADQRTFTELMINAMKTWANTAGQLDNSNRPIGLPVGLTASKIIANVALLSFDRAVKQELSPIYYGRYVDDVFLVIRNSGKFSSSAGVCQFIVSRLGGLLRAVDEGKCYRFAPAYDRERSVMEFTGDKQKIFVLSGQAGLDLLDGIEQQVSNASSEWRMLADLPDDESELLKDILCPGRDARAAVDSLRKADGLSVRRLGFSLVLRSLEAIERDLSPNVWKKQRKTFFGVVVNHIITIPGVFDFFPVLPRLMGLAVACGEFEIALKLVRRFREVMMRLKQTTEIEQGDAIASCLQYTSHAFCLSALEALGPSPIVNSGLRRLWIELTSLANGQLPVAISDIRSTAFQLWLRDLGRQSYREHLMDRRSLSPQATAKAPPFECADEEDQTHRVAEIKKFITAARFSCEGEPFLGAFVFPTRPFSPAEITQVVPMALCRPEMLSRFARALRGVSIRLATSECVQPKTTMPTPAIRLPVRGAPTRPRVALTCLLTEFGSWKASVRRQIDPDDSRYFRINRLVNGILRHPKKPHYVVFPELSIPRHWFGRIAHKLAKSGISIIAGLEYEHHAKDCVSNQVWASFVTDILGYRSGVTYRQEKEEAALHEERDLWDQARLRLVPIGNAQKPVILHGQFALGILVCSELTDMQNRLCFRGKVDAIFVSEWNQDTSTFASLVEAAALDVHGYIVQVNNRAYGDSRIRAPAKEQYDRDVVRLKGGVSDYFVVAELDVPALRQFQSPARSADRPFKPVPSGFEIASFRQILPSLDE